MRRPRLKAHYSAQILGSSKVFLLTEDRYFVVLGDAAVKVLPYLDGRRTIAEIAEGLADELSLAQVLSAVGKFDAMGHLAEGRPDMADHELAYWDALEIDPEAVHERALAAMVAVVAVGGCDPGPVTSALAALGVNAQPTTEGAVLAGGRPDLVVVLVDDYLDPALEQLNAAFVAAGQQWLLVKPSGMVLWLGPLMTPHQSGCWSCLRQRLDGNRQVERYLLGKGDDATPFPTSRAWLPITTSVAADLAAAEVASILATGTSARLTDTLLTFDLRFLDTSRHTLVRQPQCAACGDPSITAQRDPRVVLNHREVRFSADGGYRTEPPEKTFDRLNKHVSPILGAVTHLHSMVEGDNGLTYGYSAGHNFAMPRDDLGTLRRNLRGQSGGKGRTDIQARVSGICEAIERYSGVWRPEEPVARARYDELGPDDAVHPGTLMLFSDDQYTHRTEWNGNGGSRLHTVPEPFRADVAVDWTTAWSLSRDRSRKVPSAYAWFGHPDLVDQFFCYSDSNGNAAGNTVEEAVLQGFCELVERDGVALWWYNRARRPGFDLDSLHEPYVDQLREYYAGIGRSLWMLDITTDLGIPAFAAVSHRHDHPAEDILLGFGAHIDPRLAALRALTETNQFLPSILRRHPDGTTNYLDDDADTLAWWRGAKLADEPWLLPDPAQPVRTTSSYEPWAGNDLAEDLRNCLRRAQDCGLEVIVLDQSRPEIELKVVKVMVPGMRHFWRRLAPGRLYDVPRQLGWLAAPLPEDQLNPWSVFF